MNQLIIIGRNIKALRERADLSQADLSRKLGLSIKTISAWETGRACPRMGAVEEMKKLFHCTINDIMDAPGQENEIIEEKPAYSVNETSQIQIIYDKLPPDSQLRLLNYAIELMFNREK